MNSKKSEFIHNMSAYRIVDNLVEHTYGDSVEFGSDDFEQIYFMFHKLGGSWQKLHSGSSEEISRLKDLLDSYFDVRSHPKEYGLDEKPE